MKVMFQTCLKKAYDSYKGDFSKALLHTGVVAYASSSAAQVGAIVMNKNTSEENKKYMIHQEIAEGAANTLLFYTVCKYIKVKCEKMLKDGTLLPKSARELLDGLKIDKVEDVEKFFKNYIPKNFLEEMSLPDIKKHLKIFIPCFKNLTAIAAAVLASNIIAPLVRNLIATCLFEKEKKNNPPRDIKIYNSK